ncbi:MAG: hypothetical protein U0325_31610 [Polyangiales bacterium]
MSARGQLAAIARMALQARSTTSRGGNGALVVFPILVAFTSSSSRASARAPPRSMLRVLRAATPSGGSAPRSG